MLSHDGRELSPTHLHRLKVYQDTLTIPSDWQAKATPDTLFFQCVSCEHVMPIYLFTKTATYQFGIQTTCTGCQKTERRALHEKAKLMTDKYDDPTVRWCFRCEQTKPITEFFRDFGCRDGYQRQCRSCATTGQRDYIERLLNMPDREVKVADHRRRQTIRLCIEHGLPIPDEDEVGEEHDIKQCSNCKHVLKLSAFYVSQRALDMKSSHCRTCNQQRHQGSAEEVKAVRAEQTRRLIEKYDLPPTDEDLKECNRCEQVKNIDAFGATRRNFDGKEYACRDCRSTYQRLKRAEKREKKNSSV